MKYKDWTYRLIILCLFSSTCFLQSIQAQNRRNLLVDGDFHYEMQNYSEATKNYFEASQKESDYKSLFNLAVSQEMQIAEGESQTAQQSMKEPTADPFAEAAIENYKAALNYEHDDTQKSLAFYNMGNTIMKDKGSLSMEKMEQAVDYYKSAIKHDPNNDPARHNLTITQIMLDRAKQQEQQQQQQQEGQGEDEDQEKKEDQEQQEQEQEEEQKGKDEKDKKESESDAKTKEEQEKEMQKQKQYVDKNEIENILKMVEKQDKEVQGKMRKQSKSGSKTKKKDW